MNNFKKILFGFTVVLLSCASLAKSQTRIDDTIISISAGDFNSLTQQFLSKNIDNITGGFHWTSQPSVDSFKVRYTYYPSLNCEDPAVAVWDRISSRGYWRWAAPRVYEFLADSLCNSINREVNPDQCLLTHASMTITSLNNVNGVQSLSPCFNLECDGVMCQVTTPIVIMPGF